jgi:hypothetical protein
VEARPLLRRLADARHLPPPLHAARPFMQIAYEAYLRGFMAPGGKAS